MDNLLVNRNVILASGSPRRKELLENAGYQFEVQVYPVDEIYPLEYPTHLVAEYLAELKSDACKSLFENPSNIVITADSIVVKGKNIFGKPKNIDDARSMLRSLSESNHLVYTGVCLQSKKNKILFTESAEVWFYAFTEGEIEYYLEKYKPFDKAGSYGIQDWLGLNKIKKIKGNNATIMGLPTSLLYHKLIQFISDEVKISHHSMH